MRRRPGSGGTPLAAKRRRAIDAVVISLTILAVGGCREGSPATGGPPDAPGLLALPVEVTVKQRSTTTVPGSDGGLLLTIDDVTRNQVMVSLTTDSGEAVLTPSSMSPEGAVPFRFGGTSYVLALKELNNAPVGDDFATFVFSTPSESALTEEGKIQRLIETVAGLRDATFIRNEREHDAQQAADHLRRKWLARAEEIETAREFIESVASRSSATGEPYRIRFPDGRVVSSGEFLRERLREIEGGR